LENERRRRFRFDSAENSCKIRCNRVLSARSLLFIGGESRTAANCSGAFVSSRLEPMQIAFDASDARHSLHHDHLIVKFSMGLSRSQNNRQILASTKAMQPFECSTKLA
jgi:hypothetical protein